MSPYSRYRPLPGSDGLSSVLQTPPGCRPSPTSACRFLRWISKLSPQPVSKQDLGMFICCGNSFIDWFF